MILTTDGHNTNGPLLLRCECMRDGADGYAFDWIAQIRHGLGEARWVYSLHVATGQQRVIMQRSPYIDGEEM